MYYVVRTYIAGVFSGITTAACVKGVDFLWSDGAKGITMMDIGLAPGICRPIKKFSRETLREYKAKRRTDWVMRFGPPKHKPNAKSTHLSHIACPNSWQVFGKTNVDIYTLASAPVCLEFRSSQAWRTSK